MPRLWHRAGLGQDFAVNAKGERDPAVSVDALAAILWRESISSGRKGGIAAGFGVARLAPRTVEECG